MAEGVFLSTIEKLCNDLRSSLVQEYQTSVASLQAELQAKYGHGDVDKSSQGELLQAGTKRPCDIQAANSVWGTVDADDPGNPSVEMPATKVRTSIIVSGVTQRPSLKPRASVNFSSVVQATSVASFEAEVPNTINGKAGRANLATPMPPGKLALVGPPGIVEEKEDDGEERLKCDGSDGEFSNIDEESGFGTSDDDDESYELAEIWEPSQGRFSVTSRKSGVEPTSPRMLSDVRKGTPFLNDDEASKSTWLESFRTFLETRFLLMPYSRKHVVWEVLGCFMLLYDITVVPLAIFEPEETDFTETMTWMVRFFWSLDIFISFLTGYIDNEGITIMSLPKVAKHYISAQFPLDVIVVLFDWLDAIIGVRATGMMKGGRILRIMRLLRVRKARQLWFKLAEYVNADRMLVFMRTCKNLVFLFILLHFLACLWWAVGLLEVDSGNSWISGLSDLPLEDKYLRSFHMGLANFYGNVYHEPRNTLERLYALLMLCSSFMFQIWMVSSVTTAMTHLEIVSSKRSSMFSALDRFLTLHHITRELRLKVHRSARHSLLTNERHTSEENVELLQLISEPLMVRLHVAMYAPVLRVCPFLRCLMLSNADCARRFCHTSISVEHVHKDDVIFSELEKPSIPKVRFSLNDGRLHYTSNSHGYTVETCEINWLSEPVLWTNDWIHKGTARATSDTQILCLNAETFRNVVATSLDGDQARKYGRMFVNALNGAETTSDIGCYDAILGQMLEAAYPLVWEKVSPEYQADELEGDGQERRGSNIVKRGSALLRSSLRRSENELLGSEASPSVVPAASQGNMGASARASTFGGRASTFGGRASTSHAN